MATFMEKDVLLELTANGIAECFIKKLDDEIESELWEIKRYLYKTAPHEIDYNSCLKRIKELRNLK